MLTCMCFMLSERQVGLYLCQLCQEDLTHLDVEARALHVNNCMDGAPAVTGPANHGAPAVTRPANQRSGIVTSAADEKQSMDKPETTRGEKPFSKRGLHCVNGMGKIYRTSSLSGRRNRKEVCFRSFEACYGKSRLL